MGEHTMEFLHISENITRLRQAQGLTQEVLADHIGVTKASVSKWERGQSLPDAPVLAELASFFGVTLDELVGYEPQLGREQIRRIYRELAEDFAKKPFAEVMAVCRRYIRRYGSCWPFLLQMAGLLLNHAPLAPTPEERRDALDEAESLCRRVRERCSDPGLASDASYQEAAAALMRGDAERAAALALAETGRIDLLVPFAGGYELRMCDSYVPFYEQPIEVIDWGVQVNLMGPVYFARACLPAMVRAGRGVICLIGSTDGFENDGQGPMYGTSKSGLFSFTKGLAQAGAPHGVRAFCVAPGGVLTRPNMANMPCLQHRAADPMEIVNFILYLASSDGRYVTGSVHVIDGGRLCLKASGGKLPEVGK